MNKWIIKLEKMRTKMQEYNEKEIPKYITCFYYYISNNNEIYKIKKTKIKKITKTKTKITSGELLHIICNHREPQYNLDEILLFNQDKLITIPLTIEDIKINPSLFIFHDINCIFFIFKKRNNFHAITRRNYINTNNKYTRRNNGRKNSN